MRCGFKERREPVLNQRDVDARFKEAMRRRVEKLMTRRAGIEFDPMQVRRPSVEPDMAFGSDDFGSGCDLEMPT